MHRSAHCLHDLLCHALETDHLQDGVGSAKWRQRRYLNGQILWHEDHPSDRS